MTAELVMLDAYRPFPTPEKQKEYRQKIFKEELEKIFKKEPEFFVTIAVNMAMVAVQAGANWETARLIATRSIANSHALNQRYGKGDN